MADSDDDEVLFSASRSNQQAKGLLGNGVKNIDDIMNGPKEGRRLKKTVALCAAFLGLGLAIAVLGPTLLALKDHLKVEFPRMSYVFVGRSVGYLGGSILGGILFEWFNPSMFLALTLLAAGIGLIAAPFCSHLLSLGIVISLVGLSMGGLDTGANVVCIRLWGKRSSPFLQALHFFFAVGAFVAPLLASPFLVNSLTTPPPDVNSSTLPLMKTSATVPKPTPSVSTVLTCPNGTTHCSPTAQLIPASPIPTKTPLLHVAPVSTVRACPDGVPNCASTAPLITTSPTPTKSIASPTPIKTATSPTPTTATSSAIAIAPGSTVRTCPGGATNCAPTASLIARPSSVRANAPVSTVQTCLDGATHCSSTMSQIAIRPTPTKSTTPEIVSTTESRLKESQRSKRGFKASDQSNSGSATTQSSTVGEKSTSLVVRSRTTAAQADLEDGAGLRASDTKNNSLSHKDNEVQNVYIIIGVFNILVSVSFFYFFCTSPIKPSPSAAEQNGNGDSKNRDFKNTVLFLMFLFYFLYVGAEIAFGGYIYAFATKCEGVMYDESKASLLNSAFWGAFAIGRGLSICLASVLSPYVMLILDIVGSVLASFALAIQANAGGMVLWVGTIVLGLSMASLFPAGISWFESYYKVTGNVASILIVGSAFGEMVFPLVIGWMFNPTDGGTSSLNVGPMILMYVMLASSGLTAILFVIMQYLAKQNGVERVKSPNGSNPVLDLKIGVHEAINMEELGPKSSAKQATKMIVPKPLRAKKHTE